MSAHPSVSILYFITLGLNVFILTPIILYRCHKLWTLRKKPLLIKRYPEIAILIVIIACIYTIIIRPIADLPRIIPSLVTFGALTEEIRILFYTSYHIFFSLVYYRTWLLFYDYQRAMQLIRTQWYSQIDSKVSNNSYWTLKYSAYLSSKSIILPWLCVAWILFVELFIGLSYLINQTTITQALCLSLFFIVSILLAFKIRTCRDGCFFLLELKRLCIIGFIFAIFWIIIKLSLPQQTEYKRQIKAFLNYINVVIAVYTCSDIMTRWVIEQYEFKVNGKIPKRSFAYTSTMIASRSVGLTLIHDIQRKKIRFVDITNNKDALDLFAFHLAHEFSLENLLFLFEAMYFKQECVRYGLINQNDIGVEIDFGEKMNKIRRSNSVVINMKTFYFNFKYICNRYIVEGSEYCVNVSSNTRRQIKAMLKTMDDDENDNNSVVAISIQSDEEVVVNYIEAIDSAMNEIIRLVSMDSFTRFRLTEEFQQLNLYANPDDNIIINTIELVSNAS
eukprot:154873_1